MSDHAARETLIDLARREHERAVGANALFSVEHWKHGAGPDWPHEPDDDSYTLFENCKHLVCMEARALAALRAAPAPEGETLLRETAGALWDLQSAPDCWCDTGEGNPHTEACMEATRVSRRLVAAKIHLSPASPAPTPATPKHGRSVPEGLCTACGTEPCAEHELPEPTPAGREALPVLVEAFRFTSYQNWVDTGQNKPWTWVTTTAGKHSEEICADSRGRVCRRGLDFQRAHDDGAFPVIAYRVLDAKLAALRGGQP